MIAGNDARFLHLVDALGDSRGSQADAPTDLGEG
jgi:hypothetical protein